MAESTFDRLAGEKLGKALPPPGTEARNKRRRLLVGVAVALCAGLAGVAAGAGRDRISSLFTAPPPPVVTVFHDLPDLTVNLRATSAVKLIKLGVTLRISSEHAAEVAALEPALTDALTAYLRQLDQHDLEGAAGLERLRSDLLYRIRLLAEPAPVEDVLLRTLILH